jgi:hypothetical protein
MDAASPMPTLSSSAKTRQTSAFFLPNVAGVRLTCANSLASDDTVEETSSWKKWSSQIKLGIALVAAIVATTGAAHADLTYEVAGDDLYRVETSSTMSRISYAGTERLAIQRTGKELRFSARARYVRYTSSTRQTAQAYFVQVLTSDGWFEDRVDNDPDFLTILNQPFAARLDAATLRDVRALHGRVPFAARSPLGGETVLRGYLRPGIDGPVAGHPTVAVRFEAEGPTSGALQGHADQVLGGQMRMDGTANYSPDDGILRALNVTLTIRTRLRGKSPTEAMPVKIIYRRSIRATAPNSG